MGDELRALRRLQREQEPRSPFVFTSERGGPFTTAGFARWLKGRESRQWRRQIRVHFPNMRLRRCLQARHPATIKLPRATQITSSLRLFGSGCPAALALSQSSGRSSADGDRPAQPRRQSRDTGTGSVRDCCAPVPPASEKDAPFSRAVERAGQILCRQFSAGCTTNMSGFDCRQAQRFVNAAAGQPLHPNAAVLEKAPLRP